MDKSVIYPYRPDYAVPPGYSLSDTLEALDMGQMELAKRANLTEKTISQIINGKAPISADTAYRLELVTGVSSKFWLMLESNYRLTLKRLEAQHHLEPEHQWLKDIPLKWLQTHRFIAKGLKGAVLTEAVLQFFGVTSITAWENVYQSATLAYRKSEVYDLVPGPASVWLRAGEVTAQQQSVNTFNKTRFYSALKAARTLTRTSPDVFIPEIKCLLAEAGVVWVLMPEIKGCPVSGVMRWLSPDKALIQMSLRFKREDHFWFTFFHEAKHVLQDRRKESFWEMPGITGDLEQEADKFAREMLIPPSHEHRLKSLKSKVKVKAFAEEIGISPGIVVGRLHHDGLLPRTHMHDLRRRFRWETKKGSAS